MNSPYMGNFKVTQEYKGATHDGLDLVGKDSKNIHSTVNGVVEYASWENSANHSQGFGQYVKIIDDATGYGFYFGHLSIPLSFGGGGLSIMHTKSVHLHAISLLQRLPFRGAVSDSLRSLDGTH